MLSGLIGNYSFREWYIYIHDTVVHRYRVTCFCTLHFLVISASQTHAVHLSTSALDKPLLLPSPIIINCLLDGKRRIRQLEQISVIFQTLNVYVHHGLLKLHQSPPENISSSRSLAMVTRDLVYTPEYTRARKVYCIWHYALSQTVDKFAYWRFLLPITLFDAYTTRRMKSKKMIWIVRSKAAR